MSLQKHYIGSGKSTKFNGVVVTLQVSKADRYIHKTDHGEFLSFVVSPRKELIEGKPSHNVFVLVNTPDELLKSKVAEPQPVQPPAPATAKKVSKNSTAKSAKGA